MAFITLDREKLKSNFLQLSELFNENHIQWAVVSKLLCGNPTYLKELIGLGLDQICDSRVSNLRTIKSIDPAIETIYIKPPPKGSIDEIVEFADVSMNTERETIEMLSEEAGRQGKIHKIIIMIELGELREGVLGEELMSFYEAVFKLPNIEVIGLGTNLTCMYGVLPNEDKLIQLSLYKQLIEAKFNRSIPLISGGSSVTIPLLKMGRLPRGINHFRVGESLFMGTDVYHQEEFDEMEQGIFSLFAEIIELTEKHAVPSGELGANLKGEIVSFDEHSRRHQSFRAIIDLGLLDIDEQHIRLKDSKLEVVGASSDMLVIDLGQNEGNYSVGDLIEFRMDYMGILRVMHSRYIEKRIKGN